nr:MAG TPA: hypothetical protein [Caudoviricetes sp.]
MRRKNLLFSLPKGCGILKLPHNPILSSNDGEEQLGNKCLLSLLIPIIW